MGFQLIFNFVNCLCQNLSILLSIDPILFLFFYQQKKENGDGIEVALS